MRSRRLARCATCGLNDTLCVCALLPALVPKTRVLVIAHRFELSKTTNTAKLTVRMLAGSALRARGELATAQPEAPSPGSFLLFPGPEAIPLAAALDAGLSTLVVPDGTWTQARRIARRDPACRNLPSVRLEGTKPSAYRLRRNAREHGLCTLEAVAEALRLVEGDDALADRMLALFAIWVERAERLRAGDHHNTRPGARR